MVTYLGLLVQLCYREGETLQTNITGVCGECSQCLGQAAFVTTHGMCAFWSILLKLQIALQGNFLKWALGCLQSPDLSFSGSGSWVLRKGTDPLGLCFVPFPGPSRSGDQWLVSALYLGGIFMPQLESVFSSLSIMQKSEPPGESYHPLHPSHSVSWVYSGSTISGVPCVSSGELISGCDPPGGCQSSMTPERLG